MRNRIFKICANLHANTIKDISMDKQQVEYDVAYLRRTLYNWAPTPHPQPELYDRLVKDLIEAVLLWYL